MVVTSTTSTTLLSFPTRRSSDLVVLFVVGLGVGFVTLRYPLNWLLTFSDRSFVEIITADNYFTFVAYFLLALDRKSTRLNSSHPSMSYAVSCLQKKTFL